MNREIGFLFILLGFFFYFIACKIWVEANNYFRLVSDDEKRQWKVQRYSLVVGFLGLILSSFGLFETSTKNAFNEEATNLQSFIETLIFFFYQSLFVWFNILLTRIYFYKYSISGEWKGNNHDIIFYYYTDYSSRGVENSGEGELKQTNFGDVNTFKFWYSINYRKMLVKITWKEDYKQKKEIPTFVYFGNSQYRYKMKGKDILFLDDSIGFMKRQH